jgi:GT2 family glycosyltransferase
VLEALGGLDEDFNPAYYEETDLCRRGARAGWETWYEPAAAMEHHESAALGGRRADAFLRAIYRNRMLFVLKHWTLAQFIEHFIPTERWWFTIQESRAARPYQVRAYLQALGFLLRATFCGWGITRRPLRPPSPTPTERSPA